MDLNFPLPNEQGPACLVHLYDQESTFKVNEMIEFIGILSVDPGLAVFDQHMEGLQDTAFLTPDDLTTPEEQAVHHPPPSLVPRLHCLTFHRLTHSNPCLPDAISDVPGLKILVKTLGARLYPKGRQCLASMGGLEV